MGGRSQQDGREGTRRLAERRLAPIRGVGTLIVDLDEMYDLPELKMCRIRIDQRPP